MDAPGFERSSQEIVVPVPVTPIAVDSRGAGYPRCAPGCGSCRRGADTQALLDRIEVLERRLSEVESTHRAVRAGDARQAASRCMSTRTATSTTRHSRARRQGHDLSAGARLSPADDQRKDRGGARRTPKSRNVQVGVSAAIVPQTTRQNEGENRGRRHAYSARVGRPLLHRGHRAKHAVLRGYRRPERHAARSGNSGLTLLNGYTRAARHARTQLNLREAWLRTELFSRGSRSRRPARPDELLRPERGRQRRNDAVPERRARQQPDAGPGDQRLRLRRRVRPQERLEFKVGFQQSNPEATNLSESMYTLAEVGLPVHAVPDAGEGNYRVLVPTDERVERRTATAWGLSLDQKISPTITLFGRYGDGDVPSGSRRATIDTGRISTAAASRLPNGARFQPAGQLGIRLRSDEPRRRATRNGWSEGYYNFQLIGETAAVVPSAHALETPAAAEQVGYFVPGVRLQASF